MLVTDWIWFNKCASLEFNGPRAHWSILAWVDVRWTVVESIRTYGPRRGCMPVPRPPLLLRRRQTTEGNPVPWRCQVRIDAHAIVVDTPWSPIRSLRLQWYIHQLPVAPVRRFALCQRYQQSGQIAAHRWHRMRKKSVRYWKRLWRNAAQRIEQTITGGGCRLRSVAGVYAITNQCLDENFERFDGLLIFFRHYQPKYKGRRMYPNLANAIHSTGTNRIFFFLTNDD